MLYWLATNYYWFYKRVCKISDIKATCKTGIVKWLVQSINRSIVSWQDQFSYVPDWQAKLDRNTTTVHTHKTSLGILNNMIARLQSANSYNWKKWALIKQKFLSDHFLMQPCTCLSLSNDSTKNPMHGWFTNHKKGDCAKLQKDSQSFNGFIMSRIQWFFNYVLLLRVKVLYLCNHFLHLNPREAYPMS